MPNITDNLADIHQQIENSTKNIGRHQTDITLLAVSKGQPAMAIRQAYEAGQRHFGENYLQEALEKQHQLSDLQDIQWHFIGPIQSNKTRKIAENFDWVHSVDRKKIAERLSAYRPEEYPPLNVCLQVNIDREESKSGIAIDDVKSLALDIAGLPKLKLRGLMAIPQGRPTVYEQQQPFATLKRLLVELQSCSPKLATLDTLSMGMSGDMEAAIIEGSTILRIGTAIFGPRQYPKNT